MAYATRSDVEGLIAQFNVNASTKPNAIQIDTIIAGVSNEIDVYLGPYVTVPVTTPDYFYGWLKQLNAYGAAAQVLKSMFPATVGAGEIPAWGFWKSLYDAGIKSIKDGDILPSEIQTGSARIRPSTYFTRNPTEEEDLGFAEPFFKSGKIF